MLGVERADEFLVDGPALGLAPLGPSVVCHAMHNG
jgi:hypothetical protein